MEYLQQSKKYIPKKLLHYIVIDLHTKTFVSMYVFYKAINVHGIVSEG
jgi:hypothetical protein